jgi:signal peptidase I
VLGVGLLVLLIRVVAVRAYLMPSRAMEDTLLAGDYLLVETLSRGATVPFTGWRLPALGRLRVGDVVVFASPGDPERCYAKRCVALPGQVVEVRDKAVYVDGVRWSEPPHGKHVDPRILKADQSPRDNLSPRTVPAEALFVLGDNRDNSRDSRHWGFLPEESVVGTAVLVYWSCQPDSTPGSGWRILLARLRSLPDRIRWGRAGHWVR